MNRMAVQDETEVRKKVVNHLPELVAAKFEGQEVNMSEVKRATGLNYGTIDNWMKDRINRVDFPTLVVWCDYLDCTVGDILELLPE